MSNGSTFVSPHCWTNNVRQFDPSLGTNFVYFANKIFMGVGVPDCREGQVENRAKTGKCSISQGFEGKFLLFVKW